MITSSLRSGELSGSPIQACTRARVLNRSRRHRIAPAGIALMLALMAPALLLAAEPADAVPAANDTLYQVSTYGALSAGVFEGSTQLRRLPLERSVGMGTFTGLNGEMIVLDGTVYQARADGKVIRPGLRRLTPYACVTHFEADRRCTLTDLAGNAALQARLDRMRTSDNCFYAFRIHGTFDSLRVRSVPRQSKPYPTLATALQDQVVWDLQNVKGTMVGFWWPAWVGTVNVPGYHLHFIADDRSSAGHVLDVNVRCARAAADRTGRLQLLLPGTPAFAGARL